MIAVGAIWLGSITGLLDFSWLHGFPFWPAAMIHFGAWLVYQGSVGGKRETTLTEKDRRHEMETTFAGMMEGCMKGMSDEERKKMMALCGEKMAAMCPCMGTKPFSAEEGKAMMEKMLAFCGGMMGPKAAAQTGGTEKAS
ncbi:MAG: hypothetical protein LLG97_12290 [Deltaproteobacteria bacterium]|nr:hypothetical protein [Deltaproteobacteria bacterium]